jgi:transcription elongation factor Elf1
MLDVSDNYRAFVCARCGRLATACTPERGMYSCKICDNSTTFREVRIPWSAKLFLQEVACLGVGARLLTS